MSTAITRSPILSCPDLPCILPSFNLPGHRPTCSLQTRRSSPVTRARHLPCLLRCFLRTLKLHNV
ncbi:hypothetical protein FA95DRAFT_1568038, partial [Auriscalpium vulgare]